MPTYLEYEYIFFFISISGRVRIRIFFSVESVPDLWKEIPDPHPRISRAPSSASRTLAAVPNGGEDRSERETKSRIQR